MIKGAETIEGIVQSSLGKSVKKECKRTQFNFLEEYSKTENQNKLMKSVIKTQKSVRKL